MKTISDINKVQSNDAIIVNEYIWGVSNIARSLFRIKLDTYEVEIVAYLGTLVGSDFNPSRIFVYDDTLYITMFNNGGLITYHMLDGKVEAHNMCATSTLYSRALLHENTIYIVPRKITDEIITYDISNQKIVSSYVKAVGSRGDDLAEGGQIIAPTVDGECICSIIVGTNKWISIHMESKQYQIYEIEQLNSAADFFTKENEIWILDKNGVLLVLDKDTMKVTRMKKYESFQGNYIRMISLVNIIVFIPMYGCKLYSCDYTNLELEEFKSELVEGMRIADGSLYYTSVRNNMDTYFFPCRTNILLTYNEDDKGIKKRELCFRESEIKMSLFPEVIFVEKTKECLRDFMEFLIN